MLKELLFASATAFILSAPGAMAQEAFLPGPSVPSVGNAVANTANALGSLLLSQSSGVGAMRNGLPATNMDSFVYQSGLSESIYGDEGVNGPPPFSGFQPENRINAGIFGQRDQGLTTGHGSLLPDAWGGDEFIGPEFSVSGPSNGGPLPMGIFAPLLGAAASVVGNAINDGMQDVPPPSIMQGPQMMTSSTAVGDLGSGF